MYSNQYLTQNSQIAFLPQNDDGASKLKFEEAKVSHSIMNDFFYLEYVLHPSKETMNSISVNIHEDEGFYFIYSWDGDLSFFIGDERKRNLVPHQSALIYDPNSKGINFSIKRGMAYHFGIIGFNRSQHLKPDFKTSFFYNFKRMFLDHMKPDNFVFKERPYLKLLEKVNMLSRLSAETVASEIIMEGMIFQILGIKMEQLMEVECNRATDRDLLSTREMAKVQEISNFIRENPSFEFTIEYLCRETGFSPSKLQEAFKQIHQRTVIDYIRHVRLERALELIKTTDMNISEIVYSIGLTSRSYFSKIFKNKYKCSPKSFQEKIRLEFLRA